MSETQQLVFRFPLKSFQSAPDVFVRMLCDHFTCKTNAHVVLHHTLIVLHYTHITLKK